VTDPSRAVVLAGGGVAGIAWELGMVAGLTAAGIDITEADLLVGTSAGAAVAAQITSGTSLDVLAAVQLAAETAELMIDLDVEKYRATTAELIAGATDADDARARIGRWALDADTVPEATRRAVIAARLPVHDWPAHNMVLTAVEATTGELVLFDRHGDASLVDAVAASCAVPGVWPAVTIGPKRYVDGGARSLTNADLALGHDRVLVLIPVAMIDRQQQQLDEELAALGPDVATLVVVPDDASIAAVGPNPLDPSRRAPAFEAGRAQADAVVPALKTLWH
jgi:NTE family protein